MCMGMGEGSQILIRFGGRCRVGVVGSVVSMCMGEGSLILIDFARGSTQIRKGVSKQHVGIQPTVFRFSCVVIHRLPRHP